MINIKSILLPSAIIVFSVLAFAMIVYADDVSTTVDVGNATPSVSSVSLNSASDITLTENTTTAVTVTAVVSDANGCSTLSSVKADLYRSGVTAGSCDTGGEANNNNCYPAVTCTVTGGSCTGGADTTANYSCAFTLQYYADPTDSGAYSAQNWEVTVTADDGTATGTSTATQEVNTLLSLNVTSAIDYGTQAANSDTGATNETTTVTNTGNIALDPELSGTNMTSGGDTIAVGNQEYKATAFTYGAGTDLTSSGVGIDLLLAQPTSGTAPVTDDVLWGLGIPDGQPVGTYTGTNTFTAAAAI